MRSFARSQVRRLRVVQAGTTNRARFPRSTLPARGFCSKPEADERKVTDSKPPAYLTWLQSHTTQDIFGYVTDSTLRELIWSLNKDQSTQLESYFASHQFAQFESFLKIGSLGMFLRRPKILYEFSRLLDVHPSFDVKEFMEGSEQAFCTINEAMVSGDADFLREVCEEEIFKHMLVTIELFKTNSFLAEMMDVTDTEKGCGGFTLKSSNLVDCKVGENKNGKYVELQLLFNGYFNFKSPSEKPSEDDDEALREWLAEKPPSLWRAHRFAFRSPLVDDSTELDWKLHSMGSLPTTE